MSTDIYDKQLKWKSIVLQKALENKEMEEKKQDKEFTFTPHIFSSLQKKFSGSASLLTKAAGDHHIQRQAKARSDKVSQQETSSTPRKEHAKKRKDAPKLSTLSRLPLPSELNVASVACEGAIGSIPYGPNFEIDMSKYLDGTEDNETDDFEALAAEVLERERREWRVERLRLLQCIHHQQIELAQRAAAAHERATEIAKQFSRSIELYEERLVLVENNVEHEIKGIKSIADSLKLSVSAIQASQNVAPIEARLAGLESSMTEILTRLGEISSKIK